MTINRVYILIAIFSILIVTCNKKTESDINKINLASINFNTPIDSLLNKSKFFYLPQSPIDNPLYYSFMLDSFRYNNVVFDGKNENEFYQGKPESLDDVYNINETVNRIDIYPSQDDRIDAIVLIINDKELAMELLKLLDMSSKENIKAWTDTSLQKSYLIKRESWTIDDTEMLTLTLCIVRSDESQLSQSLQAYIRE